MGHSQTGAWSFGHGVLQFFMPLKPVRITMEYSSSGKATGEADAHFESHEDAVAAMLKDRSLVRKYCLYVMPPL